MQRLPSSRYSEPISKAYALLPKPLRERLGTVDFICDQHPTFYGFRKWDASYRVNACYISTRLQGNLPADQRRPTISLPLPWAAQPYVVIHELGHALHELIGWEATVQPCTEYAKTNRREAFSEAFVAWVGFSGEYETADAYIQKFDPAAWDLYERLGRGEPWNRGLIRVGF